MTSRPLSRRSKALTLVPLALLSGVWTASLVNSSATASDQNQASALPDGTNVPNEAIEAPASVPVNGVIAPAVPDGSADSVVAGASSNGIPAPALAAYQRGAQIIDAADKSCNIPWELIAAIGRVESDHGRYGGNKLTESGVSKPGIYGIALNGKNGTQAINDTDGGELDNDKVYDRAVGSMQFIPSTWQVVKVDADGDSKRNPQDIDDSALATAVYLCSGKDNLSQRKGQEAAVFRYNHSQEYVNLVLRIMEAYSSGDYSAVPSGAQGGTSFSSSSSSYSSAIDQKYKAVKQREARQKAAKQRRQQAAASGGSTSSGSSSAAARAPAAPRVAPAACPAPTAAEPPPVVAATRLATRSRRPPKASRRPVAAAGGGGGGGGPPAAAVLLPWRPPRARSLAVCQLDTADRACGLPTGSLDQPCKNPRPSAGGSCVPGLSGFVARRTTAPMPVPRRLPQLLELRPIHPVHRHPV